MNDSRPGTPETDSIEEVVLPDPMGTPEIRLGTGSVLDLSTRMLGLATSFIAGILVARLFGVDGKGMLSIVSQVSGILVVALEFGIGTSTLYFVSRGKLKPGTAAANALVLAVVMGALGAPVIYLFLSGPFAIVPGVPLSATVLAMCLVPLGLLAAWMASISVGLSNLAVPLRSAVASSLVTLAGLGAVLAVGNSSLSAILAASVLGSIAGILTTAIGLRSWLHPFVTSVTAMRGTATFSAKAYVSNMAGLLHERQDVLVLGWLAGTSAVGLYSVGVSFAELTWYVPNALGAAILAKGSRRSDLSAVDYTMRTTRVAVIFMVLTSAAGVVLVPIVIPLIYGAAFAPAKYAFLALLPGVFADGVNRIVWSYQTTRGRLYWRYALGSMIVNLIAVFALTPTLGAVGAALASSLSYTLLAVLLVGRFCRDTGASVREVLLPQRSDFEVIWRTAKQVGRRKAESQ